MKILIHAAEPAPLVDQLKQAHPDVTVETCNSYDGLAGLLAAFRPDAVYSIRFAGTKDFPAQALLGEDGPAWLAIGGSGIDHLGRWDPRKITVTNSAGVAAAMMAEFIFGSFLYFSLDIPGLNQDKASRFWDSKRLLSPLDGKTVLIVGLGHTGRQVARLAKSFGMQVLGTRASVVPTENVDQVGINSDLPVFLAQADYIAVCAPLLSSTRGLLDHKAFERIKPGAVLADVSRGGIIVQEALTNALNKERLRGAALDVFETEPLPQDSPLWDFENVLISPHCSSVYTEWERDSMTLFCENLSRWKHGEPLVNIVDPSRGY